MAAALLRIQWHRAAIDSFERGMGIAREETVETPDGGVTVELVNPAGLRGFEISHRKRRIWGVLEMFDDTRGPIRPDSPYLRPANGDED